MSDKSQIEITKSEPRIVSGFWRRVGAFFIDALILGVFGFLLGLLFFDFFVEMGPWGRLLGFFIAIFYFGILNSKIGVGQTLGKRLLKIRTEKVSGGYLGVGQSFLRFFIFGLFYFLNNAEIPLAVSNIFVEWFVLVVVFGLGGSIIYLFIFNRKTRQATHDLLVGSVVVMAGANPKREIQKIWRGHFVAVGAILLVVLSVPFLIKKLGKPGTFQELTSVYQEINKLPNVRSSGVQVGSTSTISSKTGSNTTTFFLVLLIMEKDLDDYNDFANEVAFLVLDKYPKAISKDRLILQFQFGYDIGIAQWSQTTNMNFSVQDWIKRLQGTMSEEVA